MGLHDEWVARDAAVVWHGFTQMDAFAENSPVLVERGSFRPPTVVNIDMLEAARAEFASDPAVAGRTVADLNLHGEGSMRIAARGWSCIFEGELACDGSNDWGGFTRSWQVEAGDNGAEQRPRKYSAGDCRASIHLSSGIENLTRQQLEARAVRRQLECNREATVGASGSVYCP